MKSLTKPVQPFAPSAGRPTVLPHAVTAVAYLAASLCIAFAEVIVGDLDSLDDVSAIAEGSDRLTGAGLLHLAGGVLLAFAVVGLAPLVWRSVVGRVGWCLLVVAVPCAGAFAMLHLLAVQTAAPGLDAPAMEQFLVERLSESPGAWAIPVALVALVGPVAEMLLLVGLARCGVASWWAPGIVLIGAIVHGVVPGELVEVASHWTMSLGAAVAAYGIWQHGRGHRRTGDPVREPSRV